MKQIISQAQVEETIHGKTYKVAITKAGDHYNVKMQMDTTEETYEDVMDYLEGIFECMKLVYVGDKAASLTNPIEDEPEPVEEQPKKRGWPKGKKRTGQANLGGRPRKNKAVVTTKDLEKKSKKLSEFDPFTFVKNIVDHESGLREDGLL